MSSSNQIVAQSPRRRGGIEGLFFSLPAPHQRRRIWELARAGLSPDFIAALTFRGVGEVRAAIAGPQNAEGEA